MGKKCLIIHMPVLHKGYLDFLKANKGRVADTYIISQDLVEECGGQKPDIASFDDVTARNVLVAFDFSPVSLLSKKNVAAVKGAQVIMVQDEVSRNLHKKYLQGQEVEWAPVFLRWDKASVLAENALDVPASRRVFDREMMKEAYKEAEKSSDWWRQVGAVAVRGKKIFVRSYNQGVPNDHAPYAVGAVRDFLGSGERPELANYIHAEQKIVADAARNASSLNGASLYVTHFPCPVCAKLIAASGVKNLYFGEGSSALDGKQALESAGVRIFRVG